MNGQLELRIITQPYSEVYWGYFRRLVFGNSLTKHIKLSSFSYSVVIFSLPISHIPPWFQANPPDFPRLIGPREIPFWDCTTKSMQRIDQVYASATCIFLSPAAEGPRCNILCSR